MEQAQRRRSLVTGLHQNGGPAAYPIRSSVHPAVGSSSHKQGFGLVGWTAIADDASAHPTLEKSARSEWEMAPVVVRILERVSTEAGFCAWALSWLFFWIMAFSPLCKLLRSMNQFAPRLLISAPVSQNSSQIAVHSRSGDPDVSSFCRQRKSPPVQRRHENHLTERERIIDILAGY